MLTATHYDALLELQETHPVPCPVCTGNTDAPPCGEECDALIKRAKRHPHRCEMSSETRDEYVRCNEPGHYYREDGKPGSWIVCESHAIEALRWTYDQVTDLDGNPVELDEDGEIVSAA